MRERFWWYWKALEISKAEPGPRYCAECGEPNSPDAKFCSACGKML